MLRHRPALRVAAIVTLALAAGACTSDAPSTSSQKPAVEAVDTDELSVSVRGVDPWLRRKLARENTAGRTPSSLSPTTAVVTDRYPTREVRVELDRLDRRLPPCAQHPSDGAAGTDKLLLPADAAVLDHGEATWSPRPGVVAVEQVTFYPENRSARTALSQRGLAMSCPDLDLRPIAGRARLPNTFFGFPLHVQQAEGRQDGARVRVVDVWGADENAVAVARVVVQDFQGPRGDALGDGVGPKPPGSASQALGGKGDPQGGPVDPELLREVRGAAMASMQNIGLMPAVLMPGE